MKYDISFDFEKGEVDTTRGGNLSLISGKTALIGRIQKVLRTAKNRFDVYFDSGFGNDTERCLIGKSYPQAYVTALTYSEQMPFAARGVLFWRHAKIRGHLAAVFKLSGVSHMGDQGGGD